MVNLRRKEKKEKEIDVTEADGKEQPRGWDYRGSLENWAQIVQTIKVDT